MPPPVPTTWLVMLEDCAPAAWKPKPMTSFGARLAS